MTTTKLDQHEEALAEHINAVRSLREALSEVDRLAKITDEMCDTIHGLEIRAEAAEAKLEEVNKQYMGLVDLLLPHLRAAQERAIAEGRE